MICKFVIPALLPVGLFASACATAAAQSAQEASAAISERGTESQMQTLPVIPPPLSLQRYQYFASHPEEWQQFMSQLPRMDIGPARPRAASSPWQPVNANAPAGVGAPQLLTDGTVLVQQYCTQNWYKLTPDINGSYINGTWSEIAPLPAGYAPVYFAAAVLSDGRLIINGGLFNNSGCAWAHSNKGAIYDPLANTWTPVPPPPGWWSIGDAQSAVLADGTYMLADCCALTPHAALFNARSQTWTATGSGKADSYEEESWTLLPNGDVLTVDAYNSTGTCGTNTESYNPSSGRWTSAGSSPVQLSDCRGPHATYEGGPQILRADGTVVAFSAVGGGAVAGTAIFNTAKKTWAKGPSLPTIDGKNYNLADAAVAWLPSGNILFAASPGVDILPVHFFEFTTTNTIIQVADTPNASAKTAYEVNFVVLPTGQILQTDFSSTVEIYTLSESVNPSWVPVITSVPSSLARGETYKVSGSQLNGLTQGAAYDDGQMSATNFPLVRITNSGTGHVFYARTSGFSTRSVHPNAASTASFTVPASAELGPSSLVVVANGIPSAAKYVAIVR
jgi:hypothetical protein